MGTKSKISLWSSELSEESKSALPKLARNAGSVVEIGTEVIGDNLNKFLNSFSPIIEAQETNGSFLIEEVELSLSVNAKGGIELLGKVEGGATASIKIKLKRKPK